MTDYSFDIDDAIKYGVDEAILLKSIKFWIAKNEATGNHQHDGRTWTYNTVKGFAKLFPFWSEKQVRRVLDSLTKQDVLITGNYNKYAFDRTTWYALKSEADALKIPNCPNGQKEAPKKENDNCPNGQMTIAQTGEPIPDSKPDSKPVNKKESTKEKSKTKKFIKPTLEEITRYIFEKNYIVDPSAFFSYYESNGWRVGKNPMKNWKAAIATWHHKDKKGNNHANRNTTRTGGHTGTTITESDWWGTDF